MKLKVGDPVYCYFLNDKRQISGCENFRFQGYINPAWRSLTAFLYWQIFNRSES